MSQIVEAIYEDGILKTLEPLNLEERTKVRIQITGGNSLIISPKVTEPDEKLRILKEVTQRMLQNPLPPDAPHLTREELHERR
jgi:predicted DNA-binding antitoxin AbrB/MazE fold protein